VHGIYRLRLIP